MQRTKAAGARAECISFSVSLLRCARLHGLVPNRGVAGGRSGARFLLRATGTVLWSPGCGGSQQGALVQRRMRDRHSDVAGDQIARSGHSGSRSGLPSAIRPGGQHDTLLHGQTQEVLPHVQELRYHQYLEFPIDLRRDHRLRSIIPRPRESSISAASSGNESLRSRRDRSFFEKILCFPSRRILPISIASPCICKK